MSIPTVVVLVVVAVLAVVMLRRSGETVTMPSHGAPGATNSVEAALAAGRKIEAIKLYREQHGVGLREAKDAVEALLRRPSVP
jgi:ribosomal protein L7/L12